MYSKGTLYSLKIENLQATDFGNFSCESENSLGKTIKYILLSGNYLKVILSDERYFNNFWQYNSYQK